MMDKNEINLENLGYGFKKVCYGIYSFVKGVLKKLE